ncbi:MAG: hypothetical protein OSJ69_04440 [Acetatifactor sp.]|nr:hypothetical protein [Acetatifactor sp.]
MFYEKKVRYLDFYRNGERIRNGGFARTEIRGERFRLELTLKGVSAAGRTAGSVILRAGEKELLLGEIRIQNGCGEFRYEEDLKRGIDGEELEYGELTGIRIPLGEGMEAACRWPAEKRSGAEEGKISVGKETTARGFFRRKEEKETVSGMALQRGEKEAASGGFRQRGEEGTGSGVFLTGEEKETALESFMQNGEKEAVPEAFMQREEKGITSETYTQRGEEETAPESFMQSGEKEADSEFFIERGQKETAPETFIQRGEKEAVPESFMQSEEKGTVSEAVMQRAEKGTTPEAYTQGREKETVPETYMQRGWKETVRRDSRFISESETIQGAVSQSLRSSGTETEENYTRQRTEEGQEVSRAGTISKKNGRTVKLLEEKWLQLSQIYPHIRPFRDERDYLSIGPSDFVIFSEESYRAVNNSFLLHGYYNYHHLILTRMERRGEILYYAGVPGNYYDREKQVAVMFGFESFECAEEPAQQGDFGYYMMRVKV